MEGARSGKLLIGRLEGAEDLLQALTEICRKENIRAGICSVIGALTHASIGFYNQATHKYIESAHLDKSLEIVSCLGNISIKNKEIFIHAHISLADDMGAMYGGHLVPGCQVFAAEYFIQEIIGAELIREQDAATGLSLWKRTEPCA